MVSANEITIPLNPEEVAQLNRAAAVITKAYRQCWNNLAALFSPGATPDMYTPRATLITLKTDVDTLCGIRDALASTPRLTERHVEDILALQVAFPEEMARLAHTITQRCGEMVKGAGKHRTEELQGVRHDCLSALETASLMMGELFTMLEPKLAACDRINTGQSPERRTR